MAQVQLRGEGRSASTTAGASDEELLAAFNARGEGAAEAAFGALIRRHGPMVLRVCGRVLGDRHDAEDAFQACFLVLARRAGSIRRPDLLGNWLHGVALRTAREAKARHGRQRRLDPGAGRPEGAAGPDRDLIDREVAAALHEELARLPERYRAPLVLCELQGLTYVEAARRLGCPIGTVGVRLGRARARLRDRLIRRGVAPAVAAAAAGALLAEGGAAVPVGAALVASTAGAAVAIAVNRAADGFVSSATAALAVAVLGTSRPVPLQLAAAGLIAVGVAATLATFAGPPPGGTAAVAKASSAPPPQVAMPAAIVPPAVAIPPAPSAVPPGSEGPGGVAVAPFEAAPLGPAPGAGPILAALVPGRAEVARGEALFLKEWAVGDPASPRGDGLGPVFNATSCIACHGLGAPGGAGPENRNVVLISAAATGANAPSRQALGKVHPGLANARSVVVHRYGVDPAYGSWRRSFFDAKGAKEKDKAEAGEETPEAWMARVARRAGASGRGGERAARFDGGPGVALRVSERNSPALFGAGRVDAIAAEVLADEAAAQPVGVRGKVSRLADGRVGRFGWKGQIPGLHEFVRSACASELGLEVPGHAQAASPLDPSARAPGLDLDEGQCDDLVAYVRALPAPVAVDPDGPHGSPALAEGRALFAEVGCATCHAPSLGEVRGIYSDLLLHEMGSSLSDSGSYYGEGGESPGSAGPGEWRTPPLWGCRDSAPYLHDGRAETLEEAVAFHNGQATASARRYFALEPARRDAVDAFLRSLVAPSAASAPGVLLAADREARAVPPEARQAEFATRRERQEAEARQVRERDDARRRQEAEVAAQRARRNYQLGANLDRIGKPNGALRFYAEVVREAPDTPEGHKAAARIAALVKREQTP